MAGIALILTKDGAPVPGRRIEDLAGRMRYRGNTVRTARTSSAAVACISRDPAGGLASTTRWHVALDGRIDNRADLAAQLDLPRPGPGGSDDATVVAAAIEKWDVDAAPRLLGDFAIAAVHRADARALLIRDVRGLRPLYYRDASGHFACASDLQSLVRDRPASIDEGLVAEWLTGAPASHSDTLYAGVGRLPMAHYLDLRQGSSIRRQYWMPSIDAALAERDSDQRAAAFVEVLKDAVTARTAGVNRAALWLSGGLDSSTLAALLRDSYAGQWRCSTLVHRASGIDEREFAAAVAAVTRAHHTVIEAPDVTLNDITEDIAATLDVPSPPNGLQSMPGRRQTVADGFAVALSGLGSDEWFGGSFLSYGDLARSGQYAELAKTVWADRHREESTRVRLQIAAWSLCPPWVQRGVRTALGRKLTPPWISPRLARATGLEERLRTNEIASPDLALLSQRALYDDANRGGYVAGTEMQERANACCGLDERYPFHDRRVIELSLSLPESDRWSGGRYKGIIRRAMAGRLPAAVIERQTSPNANALVAATLRNIGGRTFFEQLQIADRDWVEPTAVMQLWRKHQQRTEPGIEAWQLWAIAAMELWSIHAARPASTPHGAMTSVA